MTWSAPVKADGKDGIACDSRSQSSVRGPIGNALTSTLQEKGDAATRRREHVAVRAAMWAAPPAYPLSQRTQRLVEQIFNRSSGSAKATSGRGCLSDVCQLEVERQIYTACNESAFEYYTAFAIYPSIPSLHGCGRFVSLRDLAPRVPTCQRRN